MLGDARSELKRQVVWGSKLYHNQQSCPSHSISNLCKTNINYRQVSNKKCTLVGNYTVDHSDVVGASPVGAAPTTSSFSI